MQVIAGTESGLDDAVRAREPLRPEQRGGPWTPLAYEARVAEGQ